MLRDWFCSSHHTFVVCGGRWRWVWNRSLGAGGQLVRFPSSDGGPDSSSKRIRKVPEHALPLYFMFMLLNRFASRVSISRLFWAVFCQTKEKKEERRDCSGWVVDPIFLPVDPLKFW